eukprot:5246256-Amphidinium_carterae.1
MGRAHAELSPKHFSGTQAQLKSMQDVEIKVEVNTICASVRLCLCATAFHGFLMNRFGSEPFGETMGSSKAARRTRGVYSDSDTHGGHLTA